MSSENKTEAGGAGPVPAPDTASNAQPAPSVPAGEGAQPQPPVNDEVARLKAEAADLKDRLLRAHAEMDNVRKRLEKEKADLAKFAITKFARDVVGIGDNVQRAIDAVPAKSAEQDPSLKSFLEGVSMIEREFLNVLEKHGVKRLDPKGEQFNPHLHQAVMEMPVADVPSGTVTQVFQAGYTIEDRVLRPAMVVVAKGGLKPQPPPSTTEPASDSDAAASPSAEGKGPQT
ncbi:MAG: nucleotide exchange factor GrpE [Hyphomicrobiaceae bacterium]|nr:nucleotide exchange factor GrpE [Hyphomicrobiaceae bacterium]